MSKLKKFSGFSPEIKDFFLDLKKNNNKEWFDENRPFYEKEIRDTAKSFISEMAIEFANAELPYIADPKKALFRINRDIRFSKNKDPYKTNLGMFFPFSLQQAQTKKTSSIGLYFHIDAEQVFIAGGVPMPENEKLKMIRERIAEDWEELEKLSRDKDLKKYFPDEIKLNDPLKTVPRGFDKEHPAAELLRRKDHGFSGNIDIKEIYSESLKEIVVQRAEIIAPYLEFFRSAVE
jgi:uncharacterized protein (TIGR02453 family)